MKIRNVILFFVVLLALALGPGVRRASPDSGSATFQYLAGGGAICGFFQGACPDIAAADNGETVEISGTGMLTVHPNSVGGAGTFKHKDPSGNLLESGTWTAQELISFVPYLVLPNHLARGWSSLDPRATLERLGRDPDGNLRDWSAARPHRGINAQHSGHHQLQQTRGRDHAVHQAVISLTGC